MCGHINTETGSYDHSRVKNVENRTNFCRNLKKQREQPEKEEKKCQYISSREKQNPKNPLMMDI